MYIYIYKLFNVIREFVHIIYIDFILRLKTIIVCSSRINHRYKNVILTRNFIERTYLHIGMYSIHCAFYITRQEEEETEISHNNFVNKILKI